MDPIETKPRQDLPTEILATLAEIGEQINASLDLDEVLSKTAALVRKIIDYEIFSVLLLDEQTQQLTHRFAIGYSLDTAQSWQIPLGQGITGIAAATGRPIRVGDVTQDSALHQCSSNPCVPSWPCRSFTKASSIGVLDIQSSQAGLLHARTAGIFSCCLPADSPPPSKTPACSSASAARPIRFCVLNEVGREASSILDVEELLRRAAELVKRVIDYQIHEHHALRRSHEHVSPAPRRQVRPERPGQTARVAGEGIIGAAATSGQAVRVPDVTHGLALSHGESRDALRACDSYDSQGPRHGRARSRKPAAELFHRRSRSDALDPRRRSSPYRSKMRACTRKLRATNRAWSANSHAAQRMQGALLRPVPKEDYGLDIAARILSAREVCGDLYDFLRYGSQQLGVALGDVSGKGTAAALYGAVAIGILRSLAPHKLLPAEFLRQLNHLICERRIEGRFITLCLRHLAETAPQIPRRQRRPDPADRLPQGDRCELVQAWKDFPSASTMKLPTTSGPPPSIWATSSGVLFRRPHRSRKSRRQSVRLLASARARRPASRGHGRRNRRYPVLRQFRISPAAQRSPTIARSW